MTTIAPRQDADTPELEIRPIRADDKAAMQEGFDRLSEQSRYRRFLSPHGPLSDAELRYFTEVDHHDHEALVALDPLTGQGAGVARYVRSETDPEVAEMAVAVVDDWQGRGVGSRLTTALATRARQEGIRRFTALVLAENELMLSLLADLGTVHDVRSEQGTVEVVVDLPERGLGNVSRLLRAAANGDVRPLLHRRGGRSSGKALERFRPPADFARAEVPPAEVPPAEVPPAEVPPDEVPPAEVPRAEVPPADGRQGDDGQDGESEHDAAVTP